MDQKNSVLIVDDEVQSISLLSDILRHQYTIYATKNSREAFSVARKFNPDVILLDIIMPDMDGYDVIAELKGSEDTKDIPVIFVSGLGDAPSEEKGLLAGAADYITKPFSPVIVKLRVENQMRIINLRGELKAALDVARACGALAAGGQTDE